MSNNLVSSTVSPVAPFQPLIQTQPAPAAPSTGGDFSQLLSAEMNAARGGSNASVPTPTSAGAMGPYSTMSNFTPAALPAPAAPNHAPAEAIAPPPAPVDTAGSVYPPMPPAAPAAPPAAATVPVVPKPSMAEPAAANGTYTVQLGDSLSKIARKLGGDAGHWHQLYTLNNSVVGANPDLIRPGQVLNLPANWQTAAKPPSVKLEVSLAPPAPHAMAPLQAAERAGVALSTGLPDEAPAAPTVDRAAGKSATSAAEPAEAVDAARPQTFGRIASPGDAHEAEEAIERISVAAPHAGSLAGAPPEAGEAFQNNLAAMHDALKLVPAESPDYPHFQKTVDGYEQALAAAGGPAATHAPVNAAPAPQAAAEPAATAGKSDRVSAIENNDNKVQEAALPAAMAPAPAMSPAASGVDAGPATATSVPVDARPPANATAAVAPAPEPTEDPDAPPAGFY